MTTIPFGNALQADEAETAAVRAQDTAGRLAGALYLLMMALALFAELYARGPLIAGGDAVQTARNIIASERLFRIGTVAFVLRVAGDVLLVLALYVILKPVNRNIALLAACWRMAECAVLGLMSVNDFATLSLLSGAGYLHTFDAAQLQSLARFFISLRHSSGQIGMVFFGLGSTAFAWLWLQSRYVPRVFGAWGIFASASVTIVTLILMVVPDLPAAVRLGYYVPIMLFEIALGLWLLFKGIRPAARS